MAKEATKVVVRLLPPEITEDELAGSIGEAHLQHALWQSFAAGKRYKGQEKPARNARSYIQFDTVEHAEAFIKDYHGHQFVDGHGEAFRAVVCYAPYQKVPRKKEVRDRHEGTILEDPIFKEFVESLSQPKVFVAPSNVKDELRPANPGDTPLLEHLRKKREEAKLRAEKREWKKWEKSQGYEESGGKKAKWRCSECGTAKHLEEDPDERGVFYCTPCWEYWESEAAAEPPKKSKKKKSAAAAAVEEEVEDTSSKKKKKKKKEENRADADDNWRWDESSKQEASGSSWRRSYGDDAGETAADDGKKKGKKKKKEKEEAEYSEKKDYDSNYWQSSSSRRDRYSEDTSWNSYDSSKRSRGGNSRASDSWWEEGYSNSSRGGGHDKSSAREGKWRAKR